METILGVDYSMTSPAVTLLKGSEHKATIAFARTSLETGPLKILEYPRKWETHEERIYTIATMLANEIREITNTLDLVVIEDYAFGAKGTLLHLAEALATFKTKIIDAFETPPRFAVVSPTTVKTTFTGERFASKEALIEQFRNMVPHVTTLENSAGRKKLPLDDMADSFFIARTAIVNESSLRDTGPKKKKK